MLNKDKCVGYSACVSICSTEALTMKADEDGFSYPILNKSKCIHCNKCIKVCPVLSNLRSDKKTIEFYGAKSLNIHTN